MADIAPHAHGCHCQTELSNAANRSVEQSMSQIHKRQQQGSGKCNCLMLCHRRPRHQQRHQQ